MRKDFPGTMSDTSDSTAPLGPSAGRTGGEPELVRFADLFALDDIQRMQDAFALATGVSAIILDPDGREVTRRSNPADFCQRVMQSTEQGKSCCAHSIASLRSITADTLVHTCRNAGLLEGITKLYVGRRHLASWVIGQVLDSEADLETVIASAQRLGADPKVCRASLATMQRMTKQRFHDICQATRHVTDLLSMLAMRNVRQERLIGTLRQTQKELRIRDKNLADIIDFLPDPTLVLDRTGAVVFWNRALENLTGVPAATILGKRNFAYGVPFYGEAVPLLADYARGAVLSPNARYTVVQQEEDAIIAETDAPSLPGGPRRIWVKAVALHDESGRITGSIEAIRDVTERHRTEVALRESEAMFRRIVETANEGVWAFDAESRTTFVNQRMADMLDATPEELLGQRPEAFLDAEGRKQFAFYNQRRHQGLSDIYEQRLRKKDGRYVWVLTSASPLYDASGHFLGSLGMLSDITARKQVEHELALHRQRLEAEVEKRTRDLREQATELAEANIRLSELDRLKSLFLSTVSHELRTPLTSVLGFAKLISREFTEYFQPLVKENGSLRNRARRIGENLDVVYNEAERLTRLINDVLDLNRIESGNMVWHNRMIDPVEVLRQSLESLPGLLTQRPDLHVLWDIPSTLPPLFMDPDQLLQVLSNLLNNAIKFTKSGEIYLTARQDGAALILTVRDTGIGIPTDQLESIFDKFHQVRHGGDTVDDTDKGTGLGLAICRQIVRHYGGRIWAESEPGKGSTFTVRLPLPEDAAVGKAEDARGGTL